MDITDYTPLFKTENDDVYYNVYQGTEPIILNFPHSGRLYPQKHLQFINTSLETLRLFEDPYLDILLPHKASCNTSHLINHCARAVIDVNRNLCHESKEPMLNGEAMGLIPVSFPCGKPLYIHRLNRHDIQTRIDTYYKPYHKALEKLIHYHKQKFQTVIIFDCHSMPSHGDRLDPDAYKARPDIIIGDNFGTSASQEIVNSVENSFINMGLSVFKNFPYAGGYITSHYGSIKKNIHVIQIEINRRLYMNKNIFELSSNAKKIYQIFQIMLQDLIQFLKK